MIYYVGDLHGRVEDMMAIDRQAINNGVTCIVQVGDFGIRWPGRTCSMWKYFEKRSRKLHAHRAPIWITCGGNHDNWDKWDYLSAKQGDPKLVELAPGCYYAPRGTIQNIAGIKHLFLGGAESIDKHHRIEGKDWWARESPTSYELNLAFKNIEESKPEVVVTHDCPIDIPVFDFDRKRRSTPVGLQNIFDHASHKPSRWYFGHHHSLNSWRMGQTEFYCCGYHGEYQTWPKAGFAS